MKVLSKGTHVPASLDAKWSLEIQCGLMESGCGARLQIVVSDIFKAFKEEQGGAAMRISSKTICPCCRAEVSVPSSPVDIAALPTKVQWLNSQMTKIWEELKSSTNCSIETLRAELSREGIDQKYLN
jgi:hypothetical protein